MTVSRETAAAAIIQGKWWITGGEDDGDRMTSTEVYDSSGLFIPYERIPEPRSHHNLISLNDDRAILFGDYYLTNKTFFFDTTDERWTDGPDLNTPRANCVGGMLSFDNGTRMVMAATGSGGLQSSEILNLDEPGSWFFGPDMAYGFSYGTSVPVKNTFIVVGGYGELQYWDTIWKYDIDVGNWTLMDQKLAIPRSSAAAFLVPDYYC